jgi:DMSO/TMAO reductase YedYZ molybdopterin-dependent catalytic subunit
MGLAGKDQRLTPYGGNNWGIPIELQDHFLTPTPVFFVRSNGPVPEIDPESWRLEVGGLVERPLSLSLSDIKALPTVTTTAFLECAGNSRTQFEPKAEGTPWLNEAISNATWTGTPLHNVLDAAGVKDDAVDVVAQGADFDDMKRGLPIANALDRNTLLVWEMNGEPLTVPHGAPARLIVPGWGGIASTKWLASLTVVDRPFTGFYNANNYVFTTETGAKLNPIREMPPKSFIVSPIAGATVAAGSRPTRGFAWSGFGAIAKVDVSVDGGDWVPATIDQRADRFSWVQFSFDWQAEPGEHQLRSRATDDRELTQPEQPIWNAKGYQMNAIQTVELTVA